MRWTECDLFWWYPDRLVWDIFQSSLFIKKTQAKFTMSRIFFISVVYPPPAYLLKRRRASAQTPTDISIITSLYTSAINHSHKTIVWQL